MRHFLLKFILKLLWSVGGASDAVDGLTRLDADDVSRLLPLLEAGDVVLIGNNGGLSHVAVYTGDGEIVHAMATEQTMRGKLGSLLDALLRPLRWLRGVVDNAGVIRETLAGFVERYERDTVVVLRAELSDDGLRRGLGHVHSIVGKAYDYAFQSDDDRYYCTEVALDFLEVARGTPLEVKATTVKVPGLLRTTVYEPVALWGPLPAVIANSAARAQFAERLEGVHVLE